MYLKIAWVVRRPRCVTTGPILGPFLIWTWASARRSIVNSQYFAKNAVFLCCRTGGVFFAHAADAQHSGHAGAPEKAYFTVFRCSQQLSCRAVHPHLRSNAVIPFASKSQWFMGQLFRCWPFLIGLSPSCRHPQTTPTYRELHCEALHMLEITLDASSCNFHCLGTKY